MDERGKAWSERLRGNLKTGFGRLTRNRTLAEKGHAEQTSGNAREALRKIKATFRQ